MVYKHHRYPQYVFPSEMNSIPYYKNLVYRSSSRWFQRLLLKYPNYTIRNLFIKIPLTNFKVSHDDILEFSLNIFRPVLETIKCKLLSAYQQLQLQFLSVNKYDFFLLVKMQLLRHQTLSLKSTESILLKTAILQTNFSTILSIPM